MKLKVRIKFAEPWSHIIPEVAKQCNMSVEDYCRRAVQVLTKQGLDEGEKHNGQSESRNLTGDAETQRSSHATDSNALAHTQGSEPSTAP